jgi:hypothetical protein
VLPLLGSTAPAADDNVFDQEIFFGKTKVVLRLIDNANGFAYVNVHSNEDTSIAAAKEVIAQSGKGRLIEIRHKKARNIDFVLEGKKYSFDPNRMFTAAGRKNTLIPYTSQAAVLLEQFGTSIVNTIGTKYPNPEMIIALHNSTEGGYSLDSYAKVKPFRQSVLAVHKAEGQDPDDFFFVTEKKHYDKIAAAGFNVVLQKKKGIEDDGSLSVYCAKNGIPYINVEAQHGHLKQQIAMLKVLNRLFGSQSE